MPLRPRSLPSMNQPPSFQDPLPERVDVVVIGGGMIGVSTALFLARAGVSVLLCEKGRVAGEQSSRNWGWIRQQGRDAAELPIATESLRLWESLSAELDEDIGFKRSGVLYAAGTDEALAGYERFYELAKAHQLDTRMLSGREIDAMVDAPPGQWKGGLVTPSDGRAEPFKAAPALARLARREGARIIENCAVRVVETAAGRVAGVVTELGPVRAPTVVCAGGAWSSLFLRGLGVDMPQLTVRATVARTAPGPNLFDGCFAGPDFAFRRRQDGGYTVALTDFHEHFISPDSFRYARVFLPNLLATRDVLAVRVGGDVARPFFGRTRWSADDVTPFEKTRMLDPTPTARTLARLKRRLAQRLPAYAEIALEEAWAGMIDATPDNVPMIGEAPSLKGLFLAAGFSGHGFGIGPAAGRIVADLVAGLPAGHDLHRFRMTRFEEGEPLDVGPTL